MLAPESGVICSWSVMSELPSLGSEVAWTPRPWCREAASASSPLDGPGDWGPGGGRGCLCG